MIVVGVTSFSVHPKRVEYWREREDTTTRTTNKSLIRTKETWVTQNGNQEPSLCEVSLTFHVIEKEEETSLCSASLCTAQHGMSSVWVVLLMQGKVHCVWLKMWGHGWWGKRRGDCIEGETAREREREGRVYNSRKWWSTLFFQESLNPRIEVVACLSKSVSLQLCSQLSCSVTARCRRLSKFNALSFALPFASYSCCVLSCILCCMESILKLRGKNADCEGKLFPDWLWRVSEVVVAQLLSLWPNFRARTLWEKEYNFFSKEHWRHEHTNTSLSQVAFQLSSQSALHRLFPPFTCDYIFVLTFLVAFFLSSSRGEIATFVPWKTDNSSTKVDEQESSSLLFLTYLTCECWLSYSCSCRLKLVRSEGSSRDTWRLRPNDASMQFYSWIMTRTRRRESSRVFYLLFTSVSITFSNDVNALSQDSFKKPFLPHIVSASLMF